MKRITINIFTSLAFSAVMLLTACSKDDGPIPKRIGIEDVPAITTNVEGSTATTGTITFANQAAFQGKFKVALYFTGATAPTKVDVVVRKNATLGNVKVYKAEVTTLPASFTVTASDIAALFGTPLALNDTYDFAPDIYVGTKSMKPFPP